MAGLSLRRWAISILMTVVACRSNDATAPTSTNDATTTPPPQPAPLEAAAPASPPRALTCLAERYVGRPLRPVQGWVLELPDTSTLPWDDGQRKTAADRLDRPDLEDMLAVPYPTGAIVAVTDEAHDPGRVRVEPLFRATYGATAREVAAALVDVTIAGHTVRFHRRAAPALRRVAARLESLLRSDPSLSRYFRALGGTWNARTIAGTDRTSAHAWGIAIDIDTSMSDYWLNGPRKNAVVWRNRIPQAIVDAFEAESFVWGGRWFHYDTMHFEWRPELFDAQCRSDG